MNRIPRAYKLLFAVAAVFLVVVMAIGFGGHGAIQNVAWLLAAASGLAVGVNTVTYERPVTGTTAPTGAQAYRVNQVAAVITGDNSATTFSITHNWGLTAAQLLKPYPLVSYEYILAAGYTAAALVGTRSTNAVAFTCTAFTGAGLRVTLTRPNSLMA